MKRFNLAAVAIALFATSALAAETKPQDDRASFDCTKARTTREHTACASPETRKADAEMARAFSRLLRALSPPRAEALVKSQRAFNTYVDQSCRLGGAGPKASSSRDAAGTCLAEKLTERAEFLGSLEVARADPLVIEPLVSTEFRVARTNDDSAAADWVTHDAIPLLSGAREDVAALFSAEVKRLFKPGTPLIAGRTSLIGSVTRGYSVSWLDERLASLQAVERVEAGTRVSPVEFGINLDMRAARPLQLDTVFERNTAWRDAVTQALKQELNHPGEFDTHIAAVLAAGPDTLWAFAPDKVTVSWKTMNDPGESVDVPAGVLTPFLRQDSPWRPTPR